MEELKSVFAQIVSHSAPNFLNFLPPEELEGRLEGMMENPPNSIQHLQETVEFVLSHSVNTSHRQFVNQLYGGPNPVGLAGAFLVEKMNTNQ